MSLSGCAVNVILHLQSRTLNICVHRIIIINNDIYIAQIWKIQQMCYQQLNRKVFNCFLNTSREMSGDRSSAGKLFQTTGQCVGVYLWAEWLETYSCRRLSLYVAQWVGLLWRIASWIVQFVVWPCAVWC